MQLFHVLKSVIIMLLMVLSLKLYLILAIEGLLVVLYISDMFSAFGLHNLPITVLIFVHTVIHLTGCEIIETIALTEVFVLGVFVLAAAPKGAHSN